MPIGSKVASILKLIHDARMGEVTFAREGDGSLDLVYVGKAEIDRIAKAVREPVAQTRLLAAINRLNTLYMIQRAGSGHIGTCFSVLDIMTYLWAHGMSSPNSRKKNADTFFSSKGHDAPALYATLIARGLLPFDQIHTLRRLNGLPGHPDVCMPIIATNTGSLGMGISKARGMAYAARHQKDKGTFYVILGDGELQEGQAWESLQPTKNGGYSNIVAIIDHNKIQSDMWVKNTSDLGDLEEKFAAFGWKVYRIDGHDIRAIASTLAKTKKEKKRPQVIIADTVKGKGVPLMEKPLADGMYPYHSGALSPEGYVTSKTHLLKEIRALMAKARMGTDLRVETAPYAAPTAVPGKQNLVEAHSEALVALGKKDTRIVAMDADLVKDMGVLPFKKAFPNRYVEAGIAEQDMVSFAGGMALRGMVPILHSFACFMIPRANEQIYNNSTERKKIVYVGGLAGILPGMPGHSHQSVRDIGIMSGVLGLTIIEPSDAREAQEALAFAVSDACESAYIRLVSVPWSIPFKTPAGSLATRGRGTALRKGGRIGIMTYGPILLSEAYRAAEALAKEGVEVSVYSMPWLNEINAGWFREVCKGIDDLVILDNHYAEGSLGERVAAHVAKEKISVRVHTRAISEIPACGQNAEVLAYHGLDAANIASLVKRIA